MDRWKRNWARAIKLSITPPAIINFKKRFLYSALCAISLIAIETLKIIIRSRTPQKKLKKADPLQIKDKMAKTGKRIFFPGNNAKIDFLCQYEFNIASTTRIKAAISIRNTL